MHITPAAAARAILRAGIRPSRGEWSGYAPPGWPRYYVFCAPVLPSHEATFHWMRELTRWRGRCAAVQFRIPDDQPVLVGHYGQAHAAVTAAEAVARFQRAAPAPRGLQVMIPRRVDAREITRLRKVPNFIGWTAHPRDRRAPFGKPPGVTRWEWYHGPRRG